MKRALIAIFVAVFGLLSGIFLIAWVGSYFDGFFWIDANRANGFGFITVQHGTLAFCYSGSASWWLGERHFWWLEPGDMFDNQIGTFGNRKMVRLPDDGSPRLAVGPSYYPWRWQFSSGVEWFVPIWLVAVVCGIVPAAWAIGLFDRKKAQSSEGKETPARPNPPMV